MSQTAAVVFLFDVDNTLLDNDLVQSHLKEHLANACLDSCRVLKKLNRDRARRCRHSVKALLFDPQKSAVRINTC
jgi:hypothetical protein